MKVGGKLIFLFRDSEGFGGAIYDALQPNPHSSLRKSEEKFELPLEQHGIMGQKACGQLANFIDDKGLIQVSLLLVEYYEVPTLSCVINEILRSITGECLSSNAIVTLPFILSASKLVCGDKNSSFNNKASTVYCLQIGQETDFTKDIMKAAEKLPSSVQIRSEPLACLLQIVSCLNLPVTALVGRRGIRGDQELLHEITEHLATSFKLCFQKNRIQLTVTETPKAEEPWRTLYG